MQTLQIICINKVQFPRPSKYFNRSPWQLFKHHQRVNFLRRGNRTGDPHKLWNTNPRGEPTLTFSCPAKAALVKKLPIHATVPHAHSNPNPLSPPEKNKSIFTTAPYYTKGSYYKFHFHRDPKPHYPTAPLGQSKYSVSSLRLPAPTQIFGQQTILPQNFFYPETNPCKSL